MSGPIPMLEDHHHLLAVHDWPLSLLTATLHMSAISSNSHAMVTGTDWALDILCCCFYLLYERYFLRVIVNVYVAAFNTRTRVQMTKMCFSFFAVCWNWQCIAMAVATDMYWHEVV